MLPSALRPNRDRNGSASDGHNLLITGPLTEVPQVDVTTRDEATLTELPRSTVTRPQASRWRSRLPGGCRRTISGVGLAAESGGTERAEVCRPATDPELSPAVG